MNIQHRLKMLGLTLVMAGLLGGIAVYYMTRPVLFPGDRTELRACRECGGNGVEAYAAEEGMQQAGIPGSAPGGKCVACAGAGKVTVLMPGPQHPVLMKGTVFDSAQFDQDSEVAVFMTQRNTMEPVPGAIPEALIVFQSGDQRLEARSNVTGRWRTLVPPGTWKVSVTKAGFQTYEGELVVPVLTYPIWMEKAHIKRPPEEPGQDETENGIHTQFPMTKV
jgi:hypothetical protein